MTRKSLVRVALIGVALTVAIGLSFAGAGAATADAGVVDGGSNHISDSGVLENHCSNQGQHNPPQEGGPKKNCKGPGQGNA